MQEVAVPWHLTPASFACEQSCSPMELAGQSISLDSDPAQLTSSNQIVPAPLVKPEVRAIASIMMIGSDSAGHMISYIICMSRPSHISKPLGINRESFIHKIFTQKCSFLEVLHHNTMVGIFFFQA